MASLTSLLLNQLSRPVHGQQFCLDSEATASFGLGTAAGFLSGPLSRVRYSGVSDQVTAKYFYQANATVNSFARNLGNSIITNTNIDSATSSIVDEVKKILG